MKSVQIIQQLATDAVRWQEDKYAKQQTFSTLVIYVVDLLEDFLQSRSIKFKHK